MIIYITDTPFPTSPEIIEMAQGVDQIIHGFPDWVQELGITTEGLHVIPDPVEDDTEYNAMQKEARTNAYRDEADPLFFKWQRDEATHQDWLDKIEEIKLRYPYRGQ